jgi:hypothetical protein
MSRSLTSELDDCQRSCCTFLAATIRSEDEMATWALRLASIIVALQPVAWRSVATTLKCRRLSRKRPEIPFLCSLVKQLCGDFSSTHNMRSSLVIAAYALCLGGELVLCFAPPSNHAPSLRPVRAVSRTCLSARISEPGCSNRESEGHKISTGIFLPSSDFFKPVVASLAALTVAFPALHACAFADFPLVGTPLEKNNGNLIGEFDSRRLSFSTRWPVLPSLP